MKIGYVFPQYGQQYLTPCTNQMEGGWYLNRRAFEAWTIYAYCLLVVLA